MKGPLCPELQFAVPIALESAAPKNHLGLYVWCVCLTRVFVCVCTLGSDASCTQSERQRYRFDCALPWQYVPPTRNVSATQQSFGLRSVCVSIRLKAAYTVDLWLLLELVDNEVCIASNLYIHIVICIWAELGLLGPHNGWIILGLTTILWNHFQFHISISIRSILRNVSIISLNNCAYNWKPCTQRRQARLIRHTWFHACVWAVKQSALIFNCTLKWRTPINRRYIVKYTHTWCTARAHCKCSYMEKLIISFCLISKTFTIHWNRFGRY